MNAMTARQYILVGAGVSSISAAQAIRSRDKSGEITIITDDREGYYSRPGLAYYLSGELAEKQLFPFSIADYQALRARFLRARVVRIDLQQCQVSLQDGTTLSYDRLLLATGARSIRLNLPLENLAGLFTLDTLEDARRLLRSARSGCSAVVIGGGITALEIVEGLLARGVNVHYFLRGDRYWSSVLDETESRLILQRLREHGVRVHPRTEIAQVTGHRGMLTGVRTRAGNLVACNLLVTAIGVQPIKELAEQASIQTAQGILVDEHMQTSTAGVYAAGDAAQVYDTLSGKAVLDSLWHPARQQGKIAGMNMAGAQESYRRSVPFNVTRLAGIPTTIIGAVGREQDEDLLNIARGDSQVWRMAPESIDINFEQDVNRLRLMIGEKNLIGAVVMGDQSLSRPLQYLIGEQVDITSIRPALLHPQAPVSQILVDYWMACRKKP